MSSNAQPKPNVLFDQAAAQPYVLKGWPSKVRAEPVSMASSVTLRVWSPKHEALVSVHGPFFVLYDLANNPNVMFEVLDERAFRPLYAYYTGTNSYIRQAVYAVQVTAEMLAGTTGKFVQTVGGQTEEHTLKVGDWLVRLSETFVAIHSAASFEEKFEPEVSV